MRILITSGGTTVPVDPVRNITNSSTGSFGSKLAAAALQANMDVTYLVARHGLSPFAHTFNFFTEPDWESSVTQLERAYQFSQKYHAHYQEHRYFSFNEYSETLQALVEEQQPHIIMLAAAVSDYLVDNYSLQKVRSAEHLEISLTPAPKIIHAVREWAPQAFLAGFKLLVDASEGELVSAAVHSMRLHNLDLVIANDLASIRRGAHEVLLIEKDGTYHKITRDVASAVIERVARR
jgi:phosphopantothenate---cysteine ligase (CTP)